MSQRLTRTALTLTALLALTGCELFEESDSREGIEEAAACAARVAESLQLTIAKLDDEELYEPTYTYDITKLSLEQIQELSASKSEEILGTRIDQSTNETSTAVDRFMQIDVDQNGAFFLGRDPALYRVLGETAMRLSDVIPAGCARQQAGMRLMTVDFDVATYEPSETDLSSDTESE